jgi:hypothetical protein
MLRPRPCGPFRCSEPSIPGRSSFSPSAFRALLWRPCSLRYANPPHAPEPPDGLLFQPGKSSPISSKTGGHSCSTTSVSAYSRSLHTQVPLGGRNSIGAISTGPSEAQASYTAPASRSSVALESSARAGSLTTCASAAGTTRLCLWVQ